MPKFVKNNVEDHRMLDNGIVVEDVTTFTPPTLTHPSSTIDASGMAMAIDVPDATRLEAAEYTIAHNNGDNCKLLSAPGQHTQEFRVARQKYNVAAAKMEHESVKYRMIGLHKASEPGSVERGNPLGSTERYSLIHYEEEINGVIVKKIDAATGDIVHDGVSYTSDIKNLLN